MPQDTVQDIAGIRAMLIERLAALKRADVRGQEGQAVVTLDQQAIGRLSRMDALQAQAMSKATQARRHAEAARIQAALRRMDEGEYGYCTDCGEGIAAARLAHDPATPKCIGCAKG